MKKILLIATGGTIASKITSEGLKPEIDSNELLEYLDDISDICEISSINLLNLDSTNINYEHWKIMVKCIEDNYNLYDGFVITHGTDTMAYTASALSYMIQNSNKPIIITGSQKSIYMKDSDARGNLYNAILVASSTKAAGVNIVFDNQVILGTRAKKTRTKSFNAFSSVNYPEIAIIRDKKVIFFIEQKYTDEVKFYYNLNTSVFVLKLVPGMDLKIFDYILDHYDTVILESFGVGGIPMYYEKEFSDYFEKLVLANKTIVITTQVPYEGSDLARYQVGKLIKEKYELMESYDMTLEALVCKLMWIKGITNSHKKIKELLYTPISNDIIL